MEHVGRSCALQAQPRSPCELESCPHHPNHLPREHPQSLEEPILLSVWIGKGSEASPELAEGRDGSCQGWGHWRNPFIPQQPDDTECAFPTVFRWPC